MNPKEKDELMERFLQNSRKREEMAEGDTDFSRRRWNQGQARAWKYAAKEIENLSLKHPQPLDAAEEDHGLKSAIQQAYELYEWETFWMYLEPLIAAQASITAKQKEWMEEKAQFQNRISELEQEVLRLWDGRISDHKKNENEHN